MMRESYCMICGEKKDGIPIKEDYVIEAIRWFNRKVLRQPPRNNRIVVCSSCYEKYKKQRSKYLSRQKVYIVAGILFLIFGIVLTRAPQAILLSILVCIGLYLLSLLTYLPDLELPNAAAAKSAPRARRRA
jgi:hypothetical protein